MSIQLRLKFRVLFFRFFLPSLSILTRLISFRVTGIEEDHDLSSSVQIYIASSLLI